MIDDVILIAVVSDIVGCKKIVKETKQLKKISFSIKKYTGIDEDSDKDDKLPDIATFEFVVVVTVVVVRDCLETQLSVY